MKDHLRFVDSDMHIMEPPDLFERYLDPKFRERVVLPVGTDGRPKRGTIVIDGLPTTMDAELQQYRKRGRAGAASAHSTQPLSGSRLQSTSHLDFAIRRDYDPEAQKVVWLTFETSTPELEEAVATTEAFIRDELGDARSFSLDSPKSRQPRLQQLREMGAR